MADEPEQPVTPENAEAEGRDPSDDWPVWARPFLEAFGAGAPNVSRAAKAVGVARVTVYRLRDRDEAFALALHDTREEALDRLEEVIYAQATAGMPSRKTVTKTDGVGKVVEVTESEEIVRNPTLAMFFLKRWRPEYREAFRVEQTGAGGGPVKHEVTLVEEASRAAREELERLALTDE